MAAITIRGVDPEVRDALAVHARRRGLPVAGLVRVILADWLDRPQIKFGAPASDRPSGVMGVDDADDTGLTDSGS